MSDRVREFGRAAGTGSALPRSGDASPSRRLGRPPSTRAATFASTSLPPATLLGEPEILSLQRSAGNGSVVGLLARAPVVVQRSLPLAGGGSVGDGGTNTREQVIAALDRLFALWSVSGEDYTTAAGATKGLPAGSTVGSDNAAMPILLAGLRKNEDATLAKEVGTTQLGVALTGSIGTGKVPRNVPKSLRSPRPLLRT